MTQYVEDINVGLNKFTPERWRRVWDTVQKFESLLPQLESALFQIAEPPKLFFPAFILGYEKLAINRYKYAWHEAREGSGNSWGLVSGGLTSYTTFNNGAPAAGNPFSNYALNSIEQANTEDGVVSGGVNLDGEDYPDGFCMMPVRGYSDASPCCAFGCDITTDVLDGPETWPISEAPVVVMFLFRNTQAKPLPTFAAMNQHDGNCAGVAAPPAPPATTGSPNPPAGPVRKVLQDYTAIASDDVLLVDAGGGPVTITLQAVSAFLEQRIYIKKVDPSANAVTVAAATEKIDGQSSFDITTQYDSLTLVSDDANWFIV